MTTDIEKERVRLSQQKFLEWMRRDFASSDMIPVWWEVECRETRISVYCALVPNERVEESLADPTWDLMISHGTPGCVRYHESDGPEVVEYHRFGGHTEAEPFVFHRAFHNLRPPYVEINEEFRLYHNLYHDRHSNVYIKIDDAGNEAQIIVAEPDRVRVRLAEIRQFLAAKGMHFALYFDNCEYSLLSLQKLGLTERTIDTREGRMIYSVSYGDSGGLMECQTFSRLLGKRLIPPFPKEQCGIWPYDRDQRQPVQFIIGTDESGKDICAATAEHGGSVQYLTPVWFRRTVLDKYYQQPSKYSVEDSYLRCGSLWGMTMDNHHDDYVVVWLGDLGRDLPYEEQLHWRSHNIPRCGSVSQVFFKRQIEAQFADSDQPDIEFRYQFPDFRSRCLKQLGWPVFLPLAQKDQHCFDTLRIPASNEQREFDELVLSLVPFQATRFRAVGRG